MSEIFVDGDCSVCSAYGNFLNKRNTNVSVSSQLDLNKEDIEKDQIVYIKNKKNFMHLMQLLSPLLIWEVFIK